MLSFLRDPIWTFIAAALAIITILVTIILAMKQRPRKILSYIKSEVSLLTFEEEIAGRIKVLFDDQPVGKVTLVIFKIINNGNIPITAKDYEEPISLNFGQNSVILSSEIIEKSPRQLNISLENHSENLKLSPSLLNPSDYISIKILVSDYKGQIQINNRIIGVKEIVLYSESSWLGIALLISGSIFAILGYFVSFIVNPEINENTLYSIAFFLIYSGILLDKRIRNYLNKLTFKVFGLRIKFFILLITTGIITDSLINFPPAV